MNCNIELTPSAQKELKKLDPTAKRRIQAAIDLLSMHTNPPASIQLAGSIKRRVRTGDYRIIYEIFEDKILILALKIGHRKNAYK